MKKNKANQQGSNYISRVSGAEVRTRRWKKRDGCSGGGSGGPWGDDNDKNNWYKTPPGPGAPPVDPPEQEDPD